jgi:uncharacterized protein YdeI (YjbR/CyaY-like superfamily)
MIGPTTVDDFLRDGCGRCAHYQTPACKVHRWSGVLLELRGLVRASGLAEQVKWGSPCYTLGGRNVAMVTALKEHCALSFFRGASLVDDEGALERPGPNSREGRLLRFRSIDEVLARRALVERLLQQAIALEQQGRPERVQAEPEPMPEELARRLRADPALERAFAALTPGRQRSHILHVLGAKQSETRVRRVERCVPEILAGRGFAEAERRAAASKPTPAPASRRPTAPAKAEPSAAEPSSARRARPPGRSR